MEESLILLRQLLCLPSLEDVSYLVASSRKPELVVRLNRKEKDVLRNWLDADDQIYRHFSNVFETKVEEFGRSRMDEEVLKLRVINKNVWERCVIKQVGNEMLNGKYQGSNDKTFGYLVNEL